MSGREDAALRRAAEREPEETPPPGGSWALWYALVLGFLALLIALFTWFTRTFS